MHSSFFNICYIKFCLRGHTTPANVRGHKQVLVRPSTTKYEWTFVEFFSFNFVPFFLTSNLKMRTTESWLYVSKHKISACPTTSTDYYYYFSYRKHFQETIGTFIFSYSPEKAFLHIPVKTTNNRTREYGLTNSPSLLNYPLPKNLNFGCFYKFKWKLSSRHH